MRFSFSRAFQWFGVVAGLFLLVGLNYEFDSKAGMRMNAPNEDPLSQGIRGYWKLDDGTGTNATDSSGNGNTLAFTGSPAWTTPAQIGPYMLDFSGTGQYLSVASPASGVLDFAAGASFTISGWFNRDSSGRTDTIVAKRNGIAASDDGYIVYIGADNSLYFEASDTDDTDEYQMVSSSTFTSTGWHQFAVSWNDSATTNPVNIYIDGALNNGSPTGTFANIGSLVESVAFRIGAESDAGNPFDGKLDDIRIYGYPLSADDVSKLYQTTAPAQPVDTGLVGHWTFDGPDIKGTTAIDRSGKGNNGTITGTTKTIGKLGQGLSFNGTGDVINAGSASSLDNIDLQGGGGVTFSAWIYPLSMGESGVGEIVNKGNNLYFRLRDTWGQGLHFSKYFSVGDLNYCTDGNPVTLNAWNHVVATWDGGTSATGVKIYVNGQLPSTAYTSDGSGSRESDAGEDFRIGNSVWGDETFDGRIDDVRIYNRVLSLTEITNLYNSQK